MSTVVRWMWSRFDLIHRGGVSYVKYLNAQQTCIVNCQLRISTLNVVIRSICLLYAAKASHVGVLEYRVLVLVFLYLVVYCMYTGPGAALTHDSCDQSPIP